MNKKDKKSILFIPFVYQHFPNTNLTCLINMFNQAGIGELTSSELFTNLGFTGDVTAYERDYLDHYLTFDTDFTLVAKTLRERYSFGLLSNDVTEWSHYLTAKYELDHYFEFSIISGDVGCRKPDRAIYDILLNTARNSPNKCVFVDNSVKNLIVTEKLGFHTILFNRDHEVYNGHIINKNNNTYDILKGTVDRLSLYLDITYSRAIKRGAPCKELFDCCNELRCEYLGANHVP